MTKTTHQFTRTKPITLQTYSFKKRQVGFIKSMSKIYNGKTLTEVDKDTGEIKEKPPAQMMTIIDLESGKLCEFILPTLVIATFVEKLDNDYVGKCYEISVSKEVLEGKRYKGVEVFEIVCPNEIEDVEVVAEDVEVVAEDVEVQNHAPQ